MIDAYENYGEAAQVEAEVDYALIAVELLEETANGGGECARELLSAAADRLRGFTEKAELSKRRLEEFGGSGG